MDDSFQRWLEVSSHLIQGVHSGLFFVLSESSEQPQLRAKWPKNLRYHDDLTSLVSHVVKNNKSVCLSEAQTIDQQLFDFFALPIPFGTNLTGIIAIKVKSLPKDRQNLIFRKIASCAQWLNFASDTSMGKDRKVGDYSINSNTAIPNDGFYADVVGLMASCLEQDSYHKTLLKIVVVLTGQFNCDRVAFAEYDSYRCKVITLSGSADFDQRSNLIESIADAMDEAIEQDNVVFFPQTKTRCIDRAHRSLAQKFDSDWLCTIPLIHNENFFGAVTLLSSARASLDQQSINCCQQALALITPYLVLKRAQEKSVTIKLASEFFKQLGTMLGFKFLKLKLATVLILSLIITSNLFISEYQVSADAILEGKVQRVIAAPISGYLLSASARAGDTIFQGETIATLSDSDLRLEKSKLNGRLQKKRYLYREAQSSRDLVNVRVVKEQINLINAEINQNNEALAKINLVAPFDGIIIEGDLSQLLGAPVERGDTLFKIAPLEGYRIILKVKERQISSVKEGQVGFLVLSSIPTSRLAITVSKVIAVAKAEDGQNVFRVEAALEDAPNLLRPGMEGVAKIKVGQASFWWIWTHKIRDSLSLWFWIWLP
jgi:multidrug resistance efflux pump